MTRRSANFLVGERKYVVPELKVGDRAPAFEATTVHGRPIRLADFAGQYLVLFFYPKAFTPGCTKEAKRFRDNYPEIQALGAEVVGVSVDDPTVQCDFGRENHLEFALVPDSDKTLSEQFGVLRGLLPFDKRVTFIIAPDGTILARFHHEIQIERHTDDVLRFLRAVQVGRAAS